MERPVEAGLIRTFLSLYDDLLRLLSWRTGRPDIAADLVHETYMKLATRESDERVENPRSYVLRTATNLAIDWLRRDIRIRAVQGSDDEIENIEDLAERPEARLLAQERLRLLNAALLELPPKARQALLLNRVEGLTQAEIAAKLGVSESMVTKYIAQALRHCRAWRDRSEPESTERP
jgi:RNA polymerase sigma factor (sigma-70 family)